MNTRKIENVGRKSRNKSYTKKPPSPLTNGKEEIQSVEANRSTKEKKGNKKSENKATRRTRPKAERTQNVKKSKPKKIVNVKISKNIGDSSNNKQINEMNTESAKVIDSLSTVSNLSRIDGAENVRGRVKRKRGRPRTKKDEPLPNKVESRNQGKNSKKQQKKSSKILRSAKSKGKSEKNVRDVKTPSSRKRGRPVKSKQKKEAVQEDKTPRKRKRGRPPLQWHFEVHQHALNIATEIEMTAAQKDALIIKQVSK